MALSKKVLLSLMLLSHGDNRSKLNFDQKIKAAFHKNKLVMRVIRLAYTAFDECQEVLMVCNR